VDGQRFAPAGPRPHQPQAADESDDNDGNQQFRTRFAYRRRDGRWLMRQLERRALARFEV
jgi:hypothetical protein